MKADHFKGKDAFEHLLEARQRGYAAIEETHGAELSGHLFAFLDAAKEMAFAGALLLFLYDGASYPSFFLFAAVFVLWKFGRAALLGWNRLHRLHRLIEEERWEIEHHRPQEKKELLAMYQAKGFSGKLLEEAVEVLMADDNRLLQVMLQEELGLTLESFEHPLKQGFGAALGVLVSACLVGAGFFFYSLYGLGVAFFLIIALAAIFTAKKERNRIAHAVIWNLSFALLIVLIAVFLKELL